MGAAMIRMTKLRKIYRSNLFETHALAGITLTVERGEYVSIMGPSGSGKTTLLNIAGLLDPFDDGEYLLDGESVRDLSDAKSSALRNRNIGFVFQSFQLIGELDVCDNVEVPLRYRAMPASERRDRALRAIERVGLSARIRHRASDLSGGQQQRVAIARALVGEPELLLADEPTANLDARNARADPRDHREPPRGGDDRSLDDTRPRDRGARRAPPPRPRREAHRASRAHPARRRALVTLLYVLSIAVRNLRKEVAHTIAMTLMYALGITTWQSANAALAAWRPPVFGVTKGVYRVQIARLPNEVPGPEETERDMPLAFRDRALLSSSIPTRATDVFTAPAAVRTASSDPVSMLVVVFSTRATLRPLFGNPVLDRRDVDRGGRSRRSANRRRQRRRCAAPLRRSKPRR